MKNNANIGFEKQLWDAANALWGAIPAADYRKVIVGLIFLRYISNAFEKKYAELVADGEGFEDDRDAYTAENIFFVPQEARWSIIASSAHTPEIGTVIDNAMRAIEAENKSLKNVLPKNYASPDLDKRVLGNVVDIFTNIDMSEDEESKDLLGRTYEYCIERFAEYEGKKGGEFYTPASIVKTIVAILKPLNNCRVYDPCCGSGGMFVQSFKFIQAHSNRRGWVSVYGQEFNPDTWKMAKMNLAIRGIDADLGPYQADTFSNDLHPTLKADYIMANPPFNYSSWGQEKLKDDVRWKYGTPPAGNANFAWIQHMIHHLAPNGKIGLVLANGALSSQSGGEGEIRKKIIEDDLIEGGVTEGQCAAFLDPRRSRFGGCDVDLVLTAGGDVSAEGTHDILLGQDVDQAFVVLVRNEVTALRVNTLLKHVADLTEVGSHGLKQGFLVLIGSTTGLDGLVSIGLHGLAGEGLGRGLAEFRFDLLTTLHAMDAICELCDLGFHILIGLVVFGRKSALVGGVGVEEGIHHTHELVALFTHLSNSHRKLPPLNEFLDGVQLLLELCHGAALGFVRLGRSCIDPAFFRNLSHQGVHYGCF